MNASTDIAPAEQDTGSPPAPALTGSGIITVLERAWERIRADHPEVPEVTVVTGSGYLAAEHVELPEQWWDLVDRAQHIVVCGPAQEHDALRQAAADDQLVGVVARATFM